MSDHAPRTFHIYRYEDESGISGTGVIACGVQFPPPNGRVILGWLTDINSVAVYNSVKELEHLHGHDGKSEVIWHD